MLEPKSGTGDHGHPGNSGCFFMLSQFLGQGKGRGSHPNKAGHLIVAANVLPYIVNALDIIDAPVKKLTNHP